MEAQSASRSYPFSKPNHWSVWVLFAFVFLVGLGIRLFDLTDAPLDFHPTRQLHSALMARGMFYQTQTEIPERQRETAVRQWKAEGLIEPPIMERMTALTYSLLGEEKLWVARLYSIMFWMAGSVALFLLAKELSGPAGAVAGVVYYLLLPYAAIASRTFQPDPLVTAAIIFAVWGMVRWYRTPTWGWTVIAGLLAGLAIFIKTIAVFFVGGAWLGLILAGLGLRNAITNRKVWVAAVLTVLPYALFHVYGMYISGLLQSQFSLRFFPQLWLDPTWYLRWNGQLATVIGFEWFILSILCLFTIRQSAHRWMTIGLVAGYFVYGLTLPYHISTHDYYTLPLVPVVALSLACGADALVRAFSKPRWLANVALLGVMLFFMTIKGWDTIVTLKRTDYRPEAALWSELGEKLGQGTAVVGLTHDYGMRLSYWGWLTPTNWMTSGDLAYRQLAGQTYEFKDLFAEQAEGKRYFLVTLFGELDSQPELKNYLYNNYELVEETGDYLLFDLQK